MSQDVIRFRLRLIGIIGVSMFVALFVRLWFVQIVDAEQAQSTAQSNIIRVVREEGPRGRILDRNGKVLVTNRLTNVVEIDRIAYNEALARMDEDDRESFQLEMFTRLAVEINRSESGRNLVKVSTLEAALDNQNYSNLESVPVAWDVSEDLLVLVGERPDIFPGVIVTERTVRHYPYGKYAAHILGWVGRISSEWEQVDDPENFDDLSTKPYQRRDQIGKEGIERLFEDELRGIPGERKYEVDRLNRVQREYDEERQFPQPGNDVYLTIDIDLQARVEDELAAALANAREQEAGPDEFEFRATAGSAIIMNPRNGRILAMASNPTFDISEFVGGIPQDRYEALLALNNPFVNRAITGLYEPGSTFKPFTAIAAHDHDIYGSEPYITEMDQFFDHAKEYRAQSCSVKGETKEADDAQRAAGCIFKNAGNFYTSIDLRRSISLSSDTFYYRLGEAFWINENDEDDTAIQDVAERYGFGSKSGIALPSENAGYIPTPERRAQRHNENPTAFPNPDWLSGDNIQLAIGQSDLVVSPLQLANSYAALANGGRLFNPNIVYEVRTAGEKSADGKGELIRRFKPRIAAEIPIDEEIAVRIHDGLVGTVAIPNTPGGNDGGTAFQAFTDIEFDNKKWPVAGKTGTAEVIGQADNALFAGYGPVDTRTNVLMVDRKVPGYVGVAVLEEAGFGSKSAAPLIAKIFHGLANGTITEARTADELREEYFASESFASLDVLTGDGEVDVEAIEEGDEDPDGEPADTVAPDNPDATRDDESSGGDDS